MLDELYVSNFCISRVKLCEKESLFQNEMGFQFRHSAIRRVVAKTQEIISQFF